jgi:hypothetical protein
MDSEASDVVGDWERSEPGMRSHYRGEWIAVHPQRGLVAHSQELAVVVSEVDALGLRNEVVFDCVTDER